MNGKLRTLVTRMGKFAIYTTIFIYSLSMAVAIDANGQGIMLKDVEVSLETGEYALVYLMKDLEQQSGFSFAFLEEDIADKSVFINSKSWELETLLLHVASQTNVAFKRVNDTITIKTQKENENQKVIEIVNDLVTVSGQVTDETGDVLPGATVQIKGTITGVITDIDGSYSLEVDDDDILVFSYTGFITQEINVNGRTVIDVTLETDLQSLQEVVVIGYGAVRKSDLTGSVSNVKGDVLENLPSPRVDQLLAGRMTGVQVTSSSGEPGAGANIRIRGGNSIIGNNEPLYVVDGFIAGQGFDLNTVNVNDIESIEVLKDASSIAIYGTRGANGVILITTKTGRGAGSAPVLSVNYYHGRQSTFNEIEFIDGDQYRSYREEGGDLFFSDTEANTNWFDEVTQEGIIDNFDASIRGASDNVSYYISSNFYEQKGIIEESGLSRYTVRTNLDIDLNDKIRIGTRSNFSQQKRDLDRIGMRIINGSLPVYDPFKEDGSYNDAALPSGNPFDNPLARINESINERHITDILSNFYIEFKPVKGLTIKSTVAPRLIWRKDNDFRSDLITVIPSIEADQETRFTTEFLQENTVNYNITIDDKHELSLLGGFTWQTSQTEFSSTRAVGLTNDLLSFYGISTAPREQLNVSAQFPNPFQLVSWLGRFNYGYEDKYLLTLTGRVDGSSRFASSNNAYGFFPAVALAWNISNEPFLSNMSFISTLKLRASYGASGNQSISSFQALALYSGDGVVSFNESVLPAFAPRRPANPDLRWETTKQLDVGIEYGMYDDRLLLEVDVYNKETNDLLQFVDLAGQTGFTDQVLQNVGRLSNRGIEIALNGVIIDEEDFQWNTTLTLSANRTKIEALTVRDTVPTVTGLGLNFVNKPGYNIIGQVPGSYMGLEYLGTWETQEQIDEAGVIAEVGDPRFLDVDGDGVYTLQNDFRILGSPQPDFFWGLNSSMSYKNWSFDFLLQGVQGNEVFNVQTAISFFDLQGNGNLYPEVLNTASPNIPRAGYRPPLLNPNSQMVEDGSHIRLRNVRLGYTITPNDMFISSCNIYFAATNLFLITDEGFRGIDPEANSIQSRSGNFNQVNQGYISDAYPSSRTFTIGINTTF